jgi:hypothetical protein
MLGSVSVTGSTDDHVEPGWRTTSDIGHAGKDAGSKGSDLGSPGRMIRGDHQSFLGRSQRPDVQGQGWPNDLFPMAENGTELLGAVR